MSDGVLFTGRAAERIAEAVRWTERERQRQLARPGPALDSVAEFAFARVTGAADTNGNYPAVLTHYDPVDRKFTDAAGTVLLRPANAEVLNSGTRYPCRGVGLWGTQLLFMTAPVLAPGGPASSGKCCDGCEIEDTPRPTANTTCDIYRAGRSPPAAPDVAGVSVYLSGVGCQPRTAVAYTHVLTCSVGTDLRDDIPNSGTLTAGPNADSVFVPNKNGTQFVVVMIRRVGWTGTSSDYLQAYVNRVQGTLVAWPTNNV